METQDDVRATHGEARAHYRAMVFRRVAVFALVTFLVLALGVILYGVVAIRTAQMTNTGTLNTTQRTLHLFLDCTSKQGKCFQQSQKRTGKLVGGVNQGSRDAAAAAADCVVRGVRGFTDIKACIDRTLAQKVGN